MPPSSVDVVIPTYNSATTIESAVASIQNQTERDIRIIVVNDGSVDATKEIVERLAAADDRIVLLEQPNSGIVDALNLGLTAVTASFVARHDADDLAMPDRFEKQLKYFSGNTDCVALSGAVRHIDEAGRALTGIYSYPSPQLANVERLPQLEPYLSHPFLMVRRCAIDKVGGYRQVFHAEDTDLYWRLQEVGRLHNLSELLGDYRVHSLSVTSSLVNGRISAINSQLSGLSARRRRAGHPDLKFLKSMLLEYKAAGTLEGMIKIGSRDLDVEEAKRLSASACAKLLELASHRSYELGVEDCTVIGGTLLPALSAMSPESRDYCRRMLSGTAARLASTGNMSAARRLVPLRLYPAVAAKWALRTVVPSGFRRTLRSVIRRDGFVK